MPRQRPNARGDVNLTLRVNAKVLMWAGVRALFAGKSVNGLIRTFLTEYAAVPQRFLDGLPPPWSDTGIAGETFREVFDPEGAGVRAREADPGPDW